MGAGRKLPIGVQTFRKIREEDCCYADKTPHIERLLERGDHYFLSRPRRFGKSLLLDTIKELFEGSEELFRGLAIHGRRDWGRRHPVLRLSFGGGGFTIGGAVATRAVEQLDAIAADHGVDLGALSPEGRLEHLLRALHRSTGERVVMLVDEYDKPILDALGDPETARANRDFLRGLYGVIKDSEAHIRFTLLTGVSKFSKVNLFSGLNNLEDITLDPSFATICGYTEEDLDTVFAQEIEGLDRSRIREWYNGYHWGGGARVYNPFDILLLCRRREYRAWWFETATPTFLVNTLIRRGVNSFDLGGMIADRGSAVEFRCRRDRPRGAAVPDWLPDDKRNLDPRRPRALPSRLPQPGGSAKPECRAVQAAGRPRRGSGAPGPAPRPPAGRQSGGCRGRVPRHFRRHSHRLAPPQRHRPLRGLLRQCLLRLPGRPRLRHQR